MNVGTFCQRVTKFGFALLESGHAIDAKPHYIQERSATVKSVQWVRTSERSLVSANPGGIWDYLALLESRDYSYLMNDGAIIQLAFTFDGDITIAHRLLFQPCPFAIGPNELARFDGGLVDLIQDVYLGNLEDQLLLRSPLRFDFAPADAKDWHPASHATFLHSECRVPLKSALSFDRFMQFVLQNFYFDVWGDNSISGSLGSISNPTCLSEHDKTRLHFNWAESN